MSRPQITLKLATSLDGKIALANGQSEWITGEESRNQGRKLRAQHDAIAVGANTANIDNPQLTARIPNAKDPVRVLFDTHLRLSLQSNLASTAYDVPVWIFAKTDSSDAAKALKEKGVQVFECPVPERLDVLFALDVLHSRGITSLLLEGGGMLAASFMKLGVIDRIEWFRAPLILGQEARSGIGALGLEDLASAYKYSRVEISELGADIYERYERVG